MNPKKHFLEVFRGFQCCSHFLLFLFNTMVITFLPFIKLALITRLDETNHLAKFESFHIEPLCFFSGRDKTLDSA